MHEFSNFLQKRQTMKFFRLCIRILQIGAILLKQSLKSAPRGVRLRETLETLGPIFVKFGQILSTRYDLLPEDIVQELTLLQDRVTPFPGELAKKMVEASLGASLPTLFQNFDPEPLASASISQVHYAVLLDGSEVVVKVLRPHIH